jgi:hypothetical protein
MARMIQPPKRGPGRPRVGDNMRIEITVPRAVVDLLMERERATSVYRTRIASNVLCQWASRETGKIVRSYNTFRP